MIGTIGENGTILLIQEESNRWPASPHSAGGFCGVMRICKVCACACRTLHPAKFGDRSLQIRPEWTMAGPEEVHLSYGQVGQ